MVISEILSTAIVFPLWFPLVFVCATIGLTWYIVRQWNHNRRWNPEGKLFIKARKDGYPILEIHALNGFFKWVLGEKAKAGDPQFKVDANTNQGIRFDPRLQSGAVPKSYTVGGLEVLRMATNSPTAMGVRNALAYDIIVDYVRELYPMLSVFPNPIIIEMVGCSRADLMHDCTNLAREYDVDVRPEESELLMFKKATADAIKMDAEKQGVPVPPNEEIEAVIASQEASFVTQYRATWLVRQFMQIQDEVAHLPLETGMKPHAVQRVEDITTKALGFVRRVSHDTGVYTGRFFAFAEAFQNNPSAFTAVDIQTFMQLFERIGLLKAENEWSKYVPLIIGCGIFVVLVAVGVILITARG